ncbi:TetR/AcrR family transcriptional regulator [Kitasatospora sp. DSM 101779]|uniref:TetR/AcrR family transcriptional regulator n=1 Tax=Kitasatospora sp. DSM 101779 TaxID=2853165 RepID=UPI0021D84D6C|nr:TetR/AcrR family transcriptional regulator [Kitasatospora sp. DSM 101779]MCU7822562.1 TetR/AcrR family transcriptional regulator [Kitasatospora sp. DSM 101779]
MDQLVRRQASVGSSGAVAARCAPSAPAGVTRAVPLQACAEEPAGPPAVAPGGAGPESVESSAGPSGVPAAPAAARRRGPALEAAIFEATLELLVSGGFARLTMEGVAGAAQTGKAALYRRWASKADLVVHALAATLPPPVDIPDLGSARAELMQLMAGFGAIMCSPAGTAIRVLMAELDHEQAVAFKDFLDGRVMRPANAAILNILGRGERRGDVRPGAATPIVADVAPAMLLYRAKVGGGVVDGAFCTELVDQVLMPMVGAY